MTTNTSTPWSKEQWAAMLERQWAAVAAAYNAARDEADRIRELYDAADRRANTILHELDYLRKYRDAYAATLRPDVTITEGEIPL